MLPPRAASRQPPAIGLVYLYRCSARAPSAVSDRTEPIENGSPAGCFLLGGQRPPQPLQATAHAAVNHIVADLSYHAAEDRRIDPGLQHDGLAEPPREPGGDHRLLALVNRDGRGDLGHRDAPMLVDQALEDDGDLGDQIE